MTTPTRTGADTVERILSEPGSLQSRLVRCIQAMYPMTEDDRAGAICYLYGYLSVCPQVDA